MDIENSISELASKANLRDSLAFFVPGFIVLTLGKLSGNLYVEMLIASLPQNDYLAGAIAVVAALFTGRLIFHVGTLSTNIAVGILKKFNCWNLKGNDAQICEIWAYLDTHRTAATSHERMVVNALFLEGLVGVSIVTAPLCSFWWSWGLILPLLFIYRYNAERLKYLQDLILKELKNA